MTTKLRYSLLKQKARSEGDQTTLELLLTLEQQQKAPQQRSSKSNKSWVSQETFKSDKISYSDLGTKFAGWVYREMQS